MMKKRFFTIFFIFFISLLPSTILADDLNEIAYQNRFLLKAGTILNNEGKGDCLIYPYFDVRTVDEKRQETIINVENFGQSGIVARLRFRESSLGRELFYKDIYIPSNGVWSGKLEISSSGYRSNVKITSPCSVVTRYDSSAFYLSSSLSNGVSFSSRYIGFNSGASSLYGFVEAIGEEKVSPQSTEEKVTRLAKSEQDCPNTLKGHAWINRLDDGVSMSYQAVAIGNFSRGQGSLFRSTNNTNPRLDTCEDTLDQLEFQLSKWEVFGPFSVNPSNQGKTSLIMNFPTKHFHYSNGKRIDKINNPFEAYLETTGEDIETTISDTGDPPVDSTITLPYSVNVIGLYKDYYGSPKGIDNLSLLTFSYDSGDVTLTAESMAQAVLIEDFEYLQERFTMYRGLPATGLLLYEYRNPDQLHLSMNPVEYSAVWEASTLESVFIPTILSGPTSGFTDVSYTYTTGGSSSSLGHAIQYQFDFGDGTTSNWLDSGTTTAAKAWTSGGVYTIRTKARCAFHTDIMSNWSTGLAVTIIAPETVSVPSFLSGTTTGIPDTSYTYSTGGSFSNYGHTVQYMFDWDDGSDSGWLPVGTTSSNKLWVNGGTYTVKARARCSSHPLIVSDWTTGLVVTIEKISAPNTPVGVEEGFPEINYTFMTGGADSNIGDSIQYQIDWGDGMFSGWQSGTSFTRTWYVGGVYLVRARARCATHTGIMSDWSSALTVTIETVSTPTKPTETITGTNSGTYKTGGSVSNLGHTVEYQFDWVGDETDLSNWGPSARSNTWSAPGIYTVRARARCSQHNTVISGWSGGLTVTIPH